MELKQYFSVLFKWSWMIVLSVALAAGLSYLATSRQPKIYQASARLLVGQGLASLNPDPSTFQISSALALTYIEIAKTTPVLKNTIEAARVQMAPGDLKERFRATLVPNTQLIEVRVDDTDPARAQLLANELAYQLTLQSPGTRQEDKQREFIQRQVEDVQRKIEDAEKTIGETRTSMQSALGARDTASKQQQISALDAQISQWQQTYASLQQLLAPRSTNFLSVIEPAQLPARPYAPNVMLNVALAAVIGLILSLGATVLIEYVDDTIKHSDDVKHALGLPLLGTVARLGNASVTMGDRLRGMFSPPQDAKDDELENAPEKIRSDSSLHLNEKLVTILAARSGDAEAYRVLRTNIQFNGVDKPIRSLLVTSSVMGEGKSLVSANLAAAMAQAGLRTILVDVDLRKPSQHRLFGHTNHAGLTDVLLTAGPYKNYLHPTGVENLSVLFTGALPPNPAEMLASQRMRAFKQQLESEVDMIVFDGPPCLPVADVAILANTMDGVLMVVDTGHTRRKEAQRTKEILTKVGARLLGVVLNRVAPNHSDYYYHYEYSSTGTKKKSKVRRTQPAPSPVQSR